MSRASGTKLCGLSCTSALAGQEFGIRIILKNGHVTLEGVVDSEADKNLVNLRARGVSGSFSVTNNLIVSANK